MGLIKKALLDERDVPQPVTPYQKSKLASEAMAFGLGQSLSVPVVVIRPCMIYGVGGKGEFYKQAQLMRRGLFPKVGLGRNLIPLVHVRDVVKGALLAADRGRPGEVYLLASERSLPLDEMRRLIMQGWGTRAIYPFVPTTLMLGIAYAFEKWSAISGTPPLATRQNIASTVGNREFSIRKSRSELGYAQAVPFTEGIAETINWFKAGAL
jgi:nucleoside-diphosphate-sugar epimerase